MDAEIRFFMSNKDEQEFLGFVKNNVDEIVVSDSETQSLVVGDCELLFTPAFFEEDSLYSGVLEIRIENVSTACKDQLRANATYKKLRNWIKKKYWSRLAFINKTKNDQLMPSRIHWLAPEAKKWKESDPDKHLLKLSKTSWMVFDIGF